MIRSLYHRAETVSSSEESITQEKAHIEKALSKCGYPKWAFEKAAVRKDIGTRLTNQQVGSGKNNSQVVLPYISDVSDKLKHTFHQFGIRVCFKPFNILRHKLVHPKDPQPSAKKCELIYGIKCLDCDPSYIGETKHALGS